MSTHIDRSKAKLALSAAMSRSTIGSRELVEVLAEACVDGFRRETSSVSGGLVGEPTRHFSARHHWVIRDDDLKLHEVFWKAAIAALAAHSAGSLALSSAAGVLAACHGIYRAAIRKGAFLALDECEVLIAVRRSRVPATARQLALSLGMPQPEVESTLSSLTRVRCQDGGIIAVVAQGSDGRWACSGI